MQEPIEVTDSTELRHQWRKLHRRVGETEDLMAELAPADEPEELLLAELGRDDPDPPQRARTVGQEYPPL